MDKITQQNAALVEESAASSQRLSQQAQELSELVERFKLDRQYMTSSNAHQTPAKKVANGSGQSPRSQGGSPQLRVVSGGAAHDDFEEF